MKKLLLALFCLCGLLGRAQSNLTTGRASLNRPVPQLTPWQRHADSIFQHLDRAPVSTGLLVNYGYALKDYNQF